MVQNLESSNILSPQDMHQRVLMQKMYSYDKDSKTGLSKAELNKYSLDSKFGGGELSEFTQKLIEKFDEVDKNKDGQLSSDEMNSLQNYRGLWSVNSLGTENILNSNANTAQQSLVGANATDILSKNIQSLVKKGLTYAKNNPQLLTQLENSVHKLI